MNDLLIENSTCNPVTQELHATLQCRPSDLYLKQHFPGFPVMPGVLLMEGFRQLLTSNGGAQCSVDGFDRFRFREFVRPDDEVELNVSVSRERQVADCVGLVGGRRVIQGSCRISECESLTNREYRDVLRSELTSWQWLSHYEELTPAGCSTAIFNSPSQFDCSRHIPPTILIEGIAQSGVRLVEQFCPPDHISALVKVTYANVESVASYRDTISLDVVAVGVQHDGAILRGVARRSEQVVVSVEFMLAFASRRRRV
ncbi:MAG: hypothetical protein KDA90_19080 [Planctomycetaceae bacterium]|nr:hypothetical protein [Planctomycetaceae bacterium]